jgi:Alr-MurF fusion protein
VSYSIKHIAQVVHAKDVIINDVMIEHLLTDSRRIMSPGTSLFFALEGLRRDGHRFIPELYKKGVRNFVVSDRHHTERFSDVNVLIVDDVLFALQELAAYHRGRFTMPVIGITGSNGKTIVKEWLFQLLYEDYQIVRSPKSYNSQIGVALSIWQMNERHELAIIEAGISQPGEMFRLEKMIRPTLGVLTNIGEAHSEGFNDDDHKFREKVTLFKNSPVLIGSETDLVFRNGVNEVFEMLGDLHVITWGEADGNEFIVSQVTKAEGASVITINGHTFSIPFTDEASVANAITCYCVLRQLNIEHEKIKARMGRLQPVNMRLELKKGINNCTVINDSYSADISSLEMALNFLDQQGLSIPKTVILSDFLQSAIPDEELYAHILSGLEKHKVSRVIAIGEKISSAFISGAKDHAFKTELYNSTEEFLKKFRAAAFKDEAILVKGARIFAFEQIIQLLEQKVHQTVLEIDLNAIVHNLNSYQQYLSPAVKVMAMVKAFAYGSGGSEIAGILQFHKVDYLGVAYADEGIELRKAGISLPVMVMNPEERGFTSIVEHQLEPELYSFESLKGFDIFLRSEGIQEYPVHIELETGMNRLGFSIDQVDQLAAMLKSTPSFKVMSCFSHLAASEEKEQDSFTDEQASRFNAASEKLRQQLGYDFIRHIANSAAVIRHPQLQMDMVRLGIGLYGVDSSGSDKLNLRTVATLRSTVAQIKHIRAGESVSYNRKSVAKQDSIIATIRIGYADGYPRRLGNGVGKMLVNGMPAPVIGTVCMDMTMIDVTGIPDVKEGDDVIVFGPGLTVQELAEQAGTIPYEIMTGVSQRVKRVYFEV